MWDVREPGSALATYAHVRECEICEAAHLSSHFFMGLRIDCLGPQARIRRAPMAHRPDEMAPGEREHSDPKGHAGPSAATRPVNSGTRDRGSDSDRRRRAPFPSAPGEELRIPLGEGSTPHGRDAKRFGSREPGAADAARAQAEESARRRI